eukprot:scaffold6987_cov21-Tisochrysis_lutea.AAC.1
MPWLLPASTPLIPPEVHACMCASECGVAWGQVERVVDAAIPLAPHPTQGTHLERRGTCSCTSLQRQLSSSRTCPG